MLKINDAAGPAICSRSRQVDTPDAKTVVFHLKVPDATFPSKIASGAGSIVDHRQYNATGCARTARPSVPAPTSSTRSTRTGRLLGQPGYQGTAEVKNSGMTLEFFHGDQTS